MAVLALDVGHVLQGNGDLVPVASLQCGREGPFQLLHQIAEAAVIRAVVRIIADTVAGQASSAGGAAAAVDTGSKNLGVQRFLPGGNLWAAGPVLWHSAQVVMPMYVAAVYV